MGSIAQSWENEKNFSSRMREFFSRYQVGEALKQSNAYKKQGYPVLEIVKYLFTLVFLNRSMFLNMQSRNAPRFGKDTVYRLKNACYINWRKFTTLISAKIIAKTIKPSISEDRRCAFVVDDSVFDRNRSKKVELLAKVYDHAHNCYLKGFRMLTLGWSDGSTFIPINFCLLSSENARSRINEAAIKRANSTGAKVRELAQEKATEVVPVLIQEAIQAGNKAKYVLFDSWFSSPKVIHAMKKLGLDSVSMVKKSSKVHYHYNGQCMSCKDIYRQNKKRRGRSRYLLSVEIQLESEEYSIPAKLIFIRNRRNRKEYLVLLSTDTSLTEDEVIQLYGKRWDIEVFFKVCKSLLRLTVECNSLSYDAMCAQTAIVFLRYMFLAVSIREEEDPRTTGPMFCLVADELADISLSQAMEKLQLFLEELAAGFNWTKAEIQAFVADFIADLPVELAQLFTLCPVCG